jgi:orotidine-5'-phosphate decarboxylase
MMESFVDRLRTACDATESLVCVGLDVNPDKIPDSVFAGDRENPRHRARACVKFNKAIVDATRDLVCAYKPNLAFYEAEGVYGILALQNTIKYIRQVAPKAVIIGDSKMGDIGETATAYAKAMFDVLQVDAVTINAWGGQDTAAPWFEKPERGAFIWCRGSNPGSSDFQDLKVYDEEGPLERLYVRMARVSQDWTVHNNLGLVMGATAPHQIAKARKSCPDVPFLIPGVGAQNGDLEAAIRNGVNADGRMAIINSSRDIIYASDGNDYADAARLRVLELREQINRTPDEMGRGWCKNSQPAISNRGTSFG